MRGFVWAGLCAVAPLFAASEFWEGSRLTGRAAPATPYASRPAFTNLAFRRLVELEPLPGSADLLLALELQDRAWLFPDHPDAAEADCSVFLRADKGQTLYSLEFHPRYPDVPDVFVCLHSREWPEGRGNRIQRYRVVEGEDGRPRVDPASAELVLAWSTAGHDGCDLRFGPDGMLYASTGDGQAPGDPANTGQRTDDLRGSILRIDVSRRPYRVPPDNPFVDTAGVRPEVWCYGLRNPWRMSFDPDGNLWVGDNGDERWEMVHRVRRGANFG